jgi:CubicO group peptidase (beta-lactamase class C family)
MFMRGATWFTLTITLCSLALVACGGSDESDDGDGGAAGIALDFGELDDAMNEFLKANSLAGAGVVIVHKDAGVLYETSYGSFEKDRLYLIASSSKVLSVGVLMHLADQGVIDIDKPIGNYLKSWTGNKPELTVAQLLSNSSGLVGLTDNPLYAPYLCQYTEGGTLTACAKSIYDAMDEADRKPPDTEFHYGGGAWQLAGGIAEQVSGKTWAQLIDEIYVKPCGTKSTGYTNQYQRAFTGGGSTASALMYPTFFMGKVSNLPMSDNPSIEGGAYTSVGDYAKILLMHLRGGTCGDERVLSEQAVARMQEDRIKMAYDGSTIDPTLAGYGLGWWVDRDHPGVVGDAGAYGAMPWLDLPRGYGAFIVLEASATLGSQLRLKTKPILDALIDQAVKDGKLPAQDKSKG